MLRYIPSIPTSTRAFIMFNFIEGFFCIY
jgi:hypothetical protein